MTLFLIAGTALNVVSCHRGEREISIKERRELVLFDESYLDDVKDHPPIEWRRIPWTAMRYYNYRFGADGSGEVWLSVLPIQGGDVEGSVVQNVSRWYGQFGQRFEGTFESLRSEPMLGGSGYLVEAEGSYAAGMGSAPRADTKMLAAAIPSGEILVTVKMIGTPEQVEAERERFLEYCKSLEIHDVLSIPDPDQP